MKLARINLIEYFATDLMLGTNNAFATDRPVQFEDKDLMVNVTAKKNETADRKSVV